MHPKAGCGADAGDIGFIPSTEEGGVGFYIKTAEGMGP
jgi:hypothetical protein